MSIGFSFNLENSIFATFAPFSFRGLVISRCVKRNNSSIQRCVQTSWLLLGVGDTVDVIINNREQKDKITRKTITIGLCSSVKRPVSSTPRRF